MKISPQQMEAFEEARLPEFEDLMVMHLARYSPLHSKALGDEGIRKLIQAGMERAKKHEFTRRGPMRFYIETTVLLGIDFDTDPQYPKIASILADRSFSDETARADEVHVWLMDYLAVVGGPNRGLAKEALKRARQLPLKGIPLTSPTLEQDLLASMRANHSEKVEYLGEPALKGLIARAIEESKRQKVYTDEGVSLFLAMMFAVGHGFTGDPKYPWVSNTLGNALLTNAEKRVERLYSKLMTYLDHVLEHLEA